MSAVQQVIASFVGSAGQPEIFTVDFTGKTGLDFATAGDGLGFTFADVTSLPSVSTIGPWFQTGTENEPGFGDQKLEVSVSALDNATALASGFKSAVDGGVTGWTASRIGAVVTMTATVNGNLQDAADVDSGLTIITTQQGAP